MTSDTDISSLKVTIMGLGLHGGGLSSALFFAERGAELTVTDLRNKNILQPIINKLDKYKIKYVLGEHREEDFLNADLVIKNPAVPLSSPFLKLAKQIETDISIFLKYNKRPIIAVTGSKGKSTTVSAIFEVLHQINNNAKLGGNITTSPLNFIDECYDKNGPAVILELSSWQLGDLKGKNLLVPGISVITNIMPDHQNRYSSMNEYIEDKKLIYANQTKSDYLICNYDDEYGRIFAKETTAKVYYVSSGPLPDRIDGAFIDNYECFVRINGLVEKVLSKDLKIPGEHNRLNLLFAALVLRLYGIDAGQINRGLGNYTGIAHRMELITIKNKVSWFNDSASTIPQATAAALRGAGKPVRLITGGTDKKLDFEGTIEAFSLAKEIYLLEGSATKRLTVLLEDKNIPHRGPYKNLESVITDVDIDSQPGEIVIFSPGATSFGMFNNEFDRGDQFRQIVLDLPL